MPNPTRQDTWLVTLSMEGRDLGVWDKKSGGEIDSDENKYPPGGMLQEFSLGGRKTYGELTMSRYYDTLRDHPIFGWFHSQIGAGRGTIGMTPLDFHGNPQGAPINAGGTLKTYTPPEVDSESGDAALVELAFTIDTYSP